MKSLSLHHILMHRGTQFHLQIHDISFGPGAIICIAGPNGSGKSTLMECLTGLLKPLRGAVLLDGQPIDTTLSRSKALIGYVPDDEDWFIKELSAQEYFALLMTIYRDAGITGKLEQEVQLLAQQLYFTAFAMPLQQLSHGNKKKVQIIAALMHKPSVIIMDEIRNGLDPLAIIAIEHILHTRATQGACIILSSHDLWWGERIATSVLLLAHGKPVLWDSVRHIRKEYGHLEKAFLYLTQKEQKP